MVLISRRIGWAEHVVCMGEMRNAYEIDGKGEGTRHLYVPPEEMPVMHMQSVLGVKQPGREADHTPASNAEVKNAWSYTSILQYIFMAWCLIKHRDNFTFTFTSYLGERRDYSGGCQSSDFEREMPYQHVPHSEVTEMLGTF
jgi:hypothetical protein